MMNEESNTNLPENNDENVAAKTDADLRKRNMLRRRRMKERSMHGTIARKAPYGGPEGHMLPALPKGADANEILKRLSTPLPGAVWALSLGLLAFVMAATSFVFSCVAVANNGRGLSYWTWMGGLGFLFGTIGLLFANRARRFAKRNTIPQGANVAGSGLNIASIVFGLTALTLWLVTAK